MTDDDQFVIVFMFFQINNAISNNNSELIRGNSTSAGISIISDGTEEFDQQATMIAAAAEQERESEIKNETDDDWSIDQSIDPNW